MEFVILIKWQDRNQLNWKGRFLVGWWARGASIRAIVGELIVCEGVLGASFEIRAFESKRAGHIGKD